MSKIRADLEGVVAVTIAPGVVKNLAAGDDVPEGVTVGDHVLASGVVDEADRPDEPEAVDEADGAGEPSKAAPAKGPYAKTRARK